MKTSTFLKLASAVAAVALSVPAMAAPVIYTFTGTFSGVNGGPFANVDATFTGMADTNDLAFNGRSYFTALTSLQAVSPTAGTFNITDPSFFYVNDNGYAGLEFGALDDTSFFSGINFGLVGYDGSTSVSTTPIDYFEGIDATFNTDRGSVTIRNATNGTFAAAVAAVPEPATWAMMLVGFGMMGASLRYRRKSTAVSFA